MTRFDKSLKFRLIAVVVIVLIGIIGVLHSAFYIKFSGFIESKFTGGAQGVAVCVAYHLMNDLESYKGFIAMLDQYKAERGYGPLDAMSAPMPREHFENDEFYQRIQKYFSNIGTLSSAKYIFVTRRLSDDTIEYILCSQPIGGNYHSLPGATDINRPASERAFTTGQPTQFGLEYQGFWGWLLGAYMPIEDDDGTVLGLVGVDVCASHFSSHLRRMQLTFLIIYAVIVVMIFLLSVKFSGTLLDPLLKDKLTGAYRKRYAEKLIQDEISTAKRERNDLALMVLDLDHFRSVNNTYGHNFGDQVLTSVSQTIRSILRHNDCFIRYGGEEFVTLFPRVNEKRAMEIAERIRHSVEISEIFNENEGVFVKVTISIGVTTLDNTAPSAKDFIERGDKALYIAKKTRNSASLYVRKTEEIVVEEHDSYILQSAIRPFSSSTIQTR